MTLRERVLQVAAGGPPFAVACPCCAERWVRFARVGPVVVATCPGGCPGRAVLAALGVPLADVESANRHRESVPMPTVNDLIVAGSPHPTRLLAITELRTIAAGVTEDGEAGVGRLLERLVYRPELRDLLVELGAAVLLREARP